MKLHRRLVAAVIAGALALAPLKAATAAPALIPGTQTGGGLFATGQQSGAASYTQATTAAIPGNATVAIGLSTRSAGVTPSGCSITDGGSQTDTGALVTGLNGAYTSGNYAPCIIKIASGHSYASGVLITMTLSGSSTITYIGFVFSGINTTTPQDVSGSANHASQPTTLTPTVASGATLASATEALVACISSNGTAYSADLAGWTVVPGAGASVRCAYQLTASAVGPYTYGFTSTTSTLFGGYVLALQPPASGAVAVCVRKMKGMGC